MFLIKIFHFLFGYVILSVKGNKKEEIITEFTKKGCRLRNLEYSGDEITFRMPLAAYEEVAEGKNYDCVEVKRTCMPFLSAERLKSGLSAGVFAFVVILVIGSRFIWSIDFDCDRDCNTENLRSAAQKAGLKVGTPKMLLKKPEEMKNIILNNAKDICWCWIYIKGTKAVVRARKSVIPPEIFDESIPCDIIAMRSGIIKRVISKKGRCTVEENQAVNAGDTVISGTFDFEDKEGYRVHSRGSVEAYTTHTISREFKQYYCYKIYTGRVRRFLTLKIYGLNLPLYIKSKINFDNYDALERDIDLKAGKNNYIGIGIRYNEVKEYRTEKEPISYESAVEFAERELEREISRELLQPAQLIDKSCDAEKIDNETVRVTVTMNFTEEIGTEKRIEEVTVVEPKNNQSDGGD